MAKTTTLNVQDRQQQLPPYQQHHHRHTLFSWLNHIKLRHDGDKSSVTNTTPTSIQNDTRKEKQLESLPQQQQHSPPPPAAAAVAPTLSKNHSNHSCHLSVPPAPPPPTMSKNQSNHSRYLSVPQTHETDTASFLSDDKSSIRSKANSMFSRPFKDNLIRFHRPHGLLFGHKQQESSTSVASSVTNNTQQDSTACSCYNTAHRRNSKDTVSNDADDEATPSISDDDNEENVSVRSKDWTKHPPCLCHITTTTSSHELNHKTSRENSVFSLPQDVDSPEVGFKKLKKDGDLVDWDELSSFLEEEEEEDESHRGSVHVCHSSTMHLRSVIRNDLIRLALNGPFKSPLQLDGKKHILHIGCSDGAWCTDVARLFPNWLVVGIDDRSGGPLLPDQRKAPKNFKYVRCFYDILRTIKDIPDNAFDLVYIRLLLDAYGDCAYGDLIREAKRICKPQGFVELYELDMRIYGNPRAGTVTHKMNSKMFHAMDTQQINPRLARSLGLMVSRVFELDQQIGRSTDDMKKRKKKWASQFEANYVSLPLGMWGGRLGVLFRDSIADFFHDFQDHIDADSTLSYDGSISSLSDDIPYDKDIETMMLEMESQKSFMNLHHVYARKS
ncbi:MAG: hypothetical protein EXX96DRAFT_501393 [Benjaminiella poitrasii]|nr:MAG: hypothetical protein EXX96DRAFT_501393 [Benjaminiella poitrasii]